jgi:hypothetical protein
MCLVMSIAALFAYLGCWRRRFFSFQPSFESSNR